MNLKKLLKGAVKVAKDNPELALGMAGVALKVTPPIVKKAAPVLLPIVLAQLGKKGAKTE